MSVSYQKPDDIGYFILRITGGFVMLTMSIWKVIIIDTWVQKYVPTINSVTFNYIATSNVWPFQPQFVVIGTAVAGVFLGGMMLLNIKVTEAATISFFFIVMTIGILAIQVRLEIVEVIIRDIGLVGIYGALIYMSYNREPESRISPPYL